MAKRIIEKLMGVEGLFLVCRIDGNGMAAMKKI